MGDPDHGKARMTIYRPLPEHPDLSARDTGLLAAVARQEARLTPEQGHELLTNAPLHTLGRYADAHCRAIHGDEIRSYIIDRNINYTNICTAKCIFCAFKRAGHEDDAYTLEHEELFEKVQELSDIGGTADPHAGRDEPRAPARLVPRAAQRTARALPPCQCPRVLPARAHRVRAFLRPARIDAGRKGPLGARAPQGGGHGLAPGRRRRDLRPGRAHEDRPWQVRHGRVADRDVRRAFARDVHERVDDVRAHRGPRRPDPPHARRARVAGQGAPRLRRGRGPGRHRGRPERQAPRDGRALPRVHLVALPARQHRAGPPPALAHDGGQGQGPPVPGRCRRARGRLGHQGPGPRTSGGACASRDRPSICAHRRSRASCSTTSTRSGRRG